MLQHADPTAGRQRKPNWRRDRLPRISCEIWYRPSVSFRNLNDADGVDLFRHRIRGYCFLHQALEARQANTGIDVIIRRRATILAERRVRAAAVVSMENKTGAGP